MKLFKKNRPEPIYWKLECKPTGKMLLYKNGQRVILKNFTLLFTTEYESETEPTQPLRKDRDES